MDRVRSTAIAVAVLVATAITVPAVAGVATAQQAQQIDDCTTIDGSGVYELNASIGETDESENTTNDTSESSGTDGGAANETATDEGTNDSGATVETDVAEDDVNASACLVVEANDVTVDGNGHTLDGSNASELNLSGNESVDATNASVGDNASVDANESVVNGIVVRPASGNETISNVTITNVTVGNWYVGVYVQNASGVTLDNVTFANNTVPGFRLVNTTDLTIRNVNQSAARAG